MKRLYTVNFDFLTHKGVSGYTRRYILNDDFADKFLNSLREQLPKMNIYVPFINPVPPELANHKCGRV